MITAIGNPVYDYIKTQKIDTKERVLSGCSTNAALALAKMGSDVRLIGALGDQELGQSLPNDAAPANLSAGVGTVRSRCAAAAIEEIGR